MYRLVPLYLLLGFCSTASAQPVLVHDTGALRLQVFNTGSVGARAGAGIGFEFFRQNTLFDGQLFVGTSAGRLSGEAFTAADWTPGQPVTVVTDEGGFQDFRASFSDQGAPAPLGITVRQRSRSTRTPPLDQGIVLEYTLLNTTTATIAGLYAGLFADFDVSFAGGDLGRFDAARNLVYTYTADQGQPYVGAVLLGDSPFAGWSADLAAGGGPTTDARVFEGMTTYGQIPAAGGDRVSVLGSGPYTIAAGDSVTVRYALIAGSTLAELTATAVAVRGQFPGIPPVNARIQSTGTAALRVFDTGYVGAINGVPADSAFTFLGTSALYEGQLIVAVSPTQISGQPYSTSPTGATPGQRDWSDGTGPTAITPAPGFAETLETVFNDAGPRNTDLAALTIRQRTSTRAGDDFVVVEVDVSSLTARSGVYVGMFADFDVTPTTAADLADYDAATQTAYTYSLTAAAPLYGVSVLGRSVSGWNLSAQTTTTGLYAGLTTPGTRPTVADDRRTIIGVGPLTLAAGVPQTVRFAYVAGESIADLLANAAAAQALTPVAGETAPSASGTRLLPAMPNPASGQTVFTFELAAPQAVRLVVSDMLGREVAVLAEGAQAAGTHTATLDASHLPAGVYVARLVAGSASITQRIVVVR